MDLSKAKANFSRLCQLLVDKGGDALRAALHAKHPPSTLAAALNANESDLQRIRHSVITDHQWNLLFPSSGATPDSKNFDITLLTVLLRNICGLPKPATGWNVMPPVGDTSESADLVRIKIFRNEVYGHKASAQLDDATFEKLWQEISTSLTRLGIPRKDIDEIKVAPLSPEEESYIEILKEWKEREDYILSKLSNVEDKVSNLETKFENILLTQSKLPEWEPTSCLPDRLPMFTGRKVEIQNVIAFLIDKESAVVSLHGGPGFGKTAIAIEVSHQLSEDHNIPVVFSQLTTAASVDEMIRQLCLDIGVNHEDDPKQSLMLWLRNIKRKVIFVMDDVDSLLENKTSFYEFVRLLRKNSSPHCQIVMTSRRSFEIPELSSEVQVDEMDDEACIELLKKKCLQKDDEFLGKLAEICGKIPLAMCIAGSRVKDFDDSNELLQHLKKQPMKALKRFESDQFVNKAINMSYEKCSNEEQEMFIRLSVFEGSFDKDAAKAVIEKGDLETTDVLQNLVSRSLIKGSTEHRYSIHLLIKHFLKDKQKGGSGKAERALAEAIRAEMLMVEYYLELGHQLTIKSYSKDGCKDNREALKRETANIHNVLKICCQQEDPSSSDISDCLVRSKIYTTSAKFFSFFVRNIVPGAIVDKFLQRCANVAEKRMQHAIKINFDCVLADQERSKSIGKSDERFISKMEEIKKEFESHYEVLKEEKSLCAHYYSQYGRYLSRKSESEQGEKRLNLRIEARKQLIKSLELRETLTDTPGGKADKVFSLLQLGTTCKFISSAEYFLKNEKASNKSLEQAEKYYREALQLSEENFGEHELTSFCYKNLGDLYLKNRKPNKAVKEYTTAKKMRENLGLNASESHVLLLNNLGKCLSFNRDNTAIEILNNARDMAEKLVESDEPNMCKTKVYTSLAIAYYAEHKVNKCPEAIRYARKALEFDGIEKIINTYEHKKILHISKH